MTLKEKMKDSLNLVKHGKTEDMLKEMNAKMQRLLEETLEKNIQLEKVSLSHYTFVCRGFDNYEVYHHNTTVFEWYRTSKSNKYRKHSETETWITSAVLDEKIK